MRGESPLLSALLRSRLRRPMIFLYLLPLVFGVAAKLLHSRGIFGEYQTVACAGIKAAAGQAFYSQQLTCGKAPVPSFVYLPGVADATGFLIRSLGQTGFFAVYLALFLICLAAMIAIPLFAGSVPGEWRQRLPFAALLSGSAVMCGNIAILLHGGILLAAMAFATTPWLLLAAIIVAAWIKPVFLAYLVVFALADMAIARKVLMIGLGAIAGILPTIAFTTSGSALSHQWLDLLQHFVCDVTPGYGILGWLQWLGVNGRSPLAQGLWAGLAIALVACAIVLVRELKLRPSERLWVGLSLACLLIPRIMSPDLFLLAPGLLVLARHATALVTARSSRLEILVLRNGPVILTGLCTLALAGGLTSAGDVTTRLVVLGFCLYVLLAGQVPLRRLAGKVATSWAPRPIRLSEPAE